ncbi:hypothetical protein AL525_005285 [Citrobacter amalonaticus]|nr:hypothetical protein AL525_005285 [Citrobacter amalonaticus]
MQCLFFVRILTCGYKCGYNYLFLFINNNYISLLDVKFESGLRTKSKYKTLKSSFCILNPRHARFLFQS